MSTSSFPMAPTMTQHSQHPLSHFPPHKQYPTTFNPNRHSLPNTNSSVLRIQMQQLQFQQEQLHHQQQQLQKQFQEKEKDSKPLGGAGGRGPRLSLDTSDERLQNITLIKHGNREYLKLFSPGLVESPVSYLNYKQLDEDKKMWENGPDEAFQKQLEKDRRDAYRARSKQQLRGFFLGLWLGCLLGVLILQQTSARVYFWSRLSSHGQDSLSSSSPWIFLLVVLTCLAVVRSGTRCMIAAIATCAAVLTCFATLIVNQSRYSPEFRSSKVMEMPLVLP